jgi:hypothetical protein
MKLLIGLLFGFLVGFPLGIYQAVNAPDGVIVRVIAILKGIVKVIGQ